MARFPRQHPAAPWRLLIFLFVLLMGMDQYIYYGYIAALFAASVIIGRIAGPIVIRIMEYLTRKTESTLDDRVLSAIKVPMESFFFIIIFYLLMHSVPELALAAQFLETYTFAIIIVVATFMLSEASGAALHWYYQEGHKEVRHVKVDLSLLPFLRKVTKLAIYAVGLTLALSATGFDITGILAVSSVAGIILGLASQETLGNIFAGIALQLDRPYHYGDIIRLPGGEIAHVQKIGMRSARLEDMSHNTIIISNSEFAKMRITNLSLPDDISIVPVQAEFPLHTDLAALKKRIVAELSREKPGGLMLERGYTLAIDMVKPSTILVSFSFWLKGYQNAEKIRGIVGRAMLDFARKKK